MNGMDKKTLLAFALSFIVFLLWAVFFSPKAPEERAEKPQAEQKEALSPREGEVERRTPTSPVTEDEFAPIIKKSTKDIRDIEVETQFYRAVFSGAGPSIKSFKLKKYLSKNEQGAPPKELIRTKNEGACGFTVSLLGEHTQNLNKAECRVNKKAIHLGKGDPPGELVYVCQSPNGEEIQTRFVFYSDRYDIDFSADKKGLSYSQGKGNNLVLNIVYSPKEAKKRFGAFEGMGLLFDGELKEVDTEDFEDESFSGQIPWISFEEPYFMTAIINRTSQNATAKGAILPNGEAKISYIIPMERLKVQDKGDFTIYMGPRDIQILKTLGKGLEKAINFGWFDIIAKPLLYALRFLNKYLSNYGLSIILLTIVIKILFWPLTYKSYKSMKEMKKLQPMMAKIREKYKNNKEEMNRQLMGLYKTYKINPMGGCLPMLVQIPVFFALYRILSNSIELRHAPFILWINDLSAPDRLFSFPFEIPFMSPPYGIPVLTLMMGASMFIQQKLTPTAGDPAQAKVMMFLPLVFTFLFINFPSGLVLYWLVNNILSIAQQYRINKK